MEVQPGGEETGKTLKRQKNRSPHFHFPPKKEKKEKEDKKMALH